MCSEADAKYRSPPHRTNHNINEKNWNKQTVTQNKVKKTVSEFVNVVQRVPAVSGICEIW